MASHPLSYDPVPSVNPSGAPGDDYEHIQASPDAFGGQIAQGEQKLGAGLERVAESGINVAIQQQGQINETLSTNAETKYRTDLGALIGRHRAMEGMEAVSALPQLSLDIQALRQKYRTDLPYVGAQRAFDTLSLRHEGNALQDAQMYAATQLKTADLHSANSSSAVAISEAGNLPTAQDDRRFQGVLDDINFATRRQMQVQGWGQYMREDAAHNLTFDEGPDGQKAKAAYEAANNKAIAMAYENRFHVLADQNVFTAWSTYQRDRAKVPGEAQVKLDAFFTPKIRDAQVRDTANGIVAVANSRYNAGANRVADVGDAIVQQESGGNPNVRNSIDGAIGPGQITPGTFAQYARPGERINNTADNLAVSRRIVEDLKQKFNNDPARVAVGYFSGEGNVAPPGSPTPYIRDAADGNGKRVSSYVQDVLARMGKGSGGSGTPIGNAANPTVPYQSQADYYRANYASILDDARRRAESDHPDDPHYADLTVARVQQHLNAQIHQQELSYKADTDLVQQAFNGDLSNKMRPTSVDQMTSISPQVKTAWDRMQINNPQAALAIETRIMTANSRQSDHDTKTYGTGFYDLFKKIHAAPDDPDRITDPTKLYGHVGPNGDLTISGMEKLTAEINSRRSPEGVAEAEMRSQFLKNARGQISGSDEGLHIKDPKGDELYLKFLAQALPAYDEGRRAGKTPGQLLNPDSPDYVGKIINGFKRPMSQWFGDVTGDNKVPASAPFDINSIDTVDKAVTAYRAGRITKAQADALAIEKGWGHRAPQAPEVPMSR